MQHRCGAMNIRAEHSNIWRIPILTNTTAFILRRIIQVVVRQLDIELQTEVAHSYEATLRVVSRRKQEIGFTSASSSLQLAMDSKRVHTAPPEKEDDAIEAGRIHAVFGSTNFVDLTVNLRLVGPITKKTLVYYQEMWQHKYEK